MPASSVTEPSGWFRGFAVYQLLVILVPCGAWVWLMKFLHQSNVDDPNIGPGQAEFWTGVMAVGSIVMTAVPLGVCWLVGSVIAAIVIAMKPGRVRSIVNGFILGVFTLLVEAGVLFVGYVFG